MNLSDPGFDFNFYKEKYRHHFFPFIYSIQCHLSIFMGQELLKIILNEFFFTFHQFRKKPPTKLTI